ncbi:hypothetical protein FACS189413_16190 [Bacteroidia bacterium]|nr:hypothetical protein FACS189413_16190 [Bacteroidia bacterium]
MNDNKIKIFIGSSSEAANNQDVAKKYLRIISSIVRRAGAEPIAWDKSPSKIFKPGKSTFENLEESITREDIKAAIFIYSKDDVTWSRGDIHSVARDNVVFEHGLFSGVLGRTKAITVKVGNIKMPSDLYGITCIDYCKNPDDAELEICQWVTELINSEQNNGFKDKNDVINQEIIQKKEDNLDILSDTVSILKNNFHKIPESWIDEIKNYILLPFEEMSKGALLGEFALNTTQYYDSVLTKFERVHFKLSFFSKPPTYSYF